MTSQDIRLAAELMKFKPLDKPPTFGQLLRAYRSFYNPNCKKTFNEILAEVSMWAVSEKFAVKAVELAIFRIANSRS